MRFKVPQNVEREDRIIAFITLRQFIILVIGGGITYSLYINMSKVYYWEVWSIPVFLIGGLTLAIAFLSIKDLNFFDLILLLIERILIPRRRIWTGGADVFYIDSKFIKKEESKIKEKGTDRKVETKNQLDKITDILDGGFGNIELEKNKNEQN